MRANFFPLALNIGRRSWYFHLMLLSDTMYNFSLLGFDYEYGSYEFCFMYHSLIISPKEKTIALSGFSFSSYKSAKWTLIKQHLSILK